MGKKNPKIEDVLHGELIFEDDLYRLIKNSADPDKAFAYAVQLAKDMFGAENP